MFVKKLILGMCFANIFYSLPASSDIAPKTSLILHLAPKTNLNFQRELREFKKRIEEIRQRYGQVWLVVAASLGTEIEKVRFHDPRWVFWNLQILGEDGIHTDGRLGIIGDGLAGENWHSIAKGLENSFDLITDDWAFEYPKDNLYTILHSMHTMLCIGGESMMKIQNFHQLLSLENDEVFEWIDENFDLRYTPASTVPFRHGGGGSNICQILASYSSEIRHAIPKGSKCDLYLEEIDPAYRKNEGIALAFLRQECQEKTRSFLARLANKSPTASDYYAEGMQLLITEAKLLVAQVVQGWKPPLARSLREEDTDLFVGSIVFQKNPP
jgi:hypothetical protein